MGIRIFCKLDGLFVLGARRVFPNLLPLTAKVILLCNIITSRNRFTAYMRTAVELSRL